MISQILCRQIPTNEIDAEETSYNLRPHTDTGPPLILQESIARNGILHPPLLLENHGRYIILSGKRRIEIAITHGLKDLPGFTLEEDLSLFKIYGHLLAHAMIGSTLSVIEQAIFFHKATDALTQEQALSFLPSLGIKPLIQKLQQFSTYLGLEDSAIHALHTGLLHPKNGIKLIKLSEEDQKIIVKLIEHFKLGGSKQRNLIDYAVELVMRTKLPLHHFISNDIRQNNEKENRPQQAAVLLEKLENQCFPNRSHAEKQFQNFKRSIQLPPNCLVQHTPSFEDDRLTLSIIFDNYENLLEGWDRIKKDL